jgi:transposase-like protein
MAASRKGKWVQRGEQEWQALLSRFAGSGMGVEAFCRGEGISAASFYRWRGLLGNGSGPGGASEAQPAFVDLGPLRPTSAANSGQTPAGRLELKLDLGGGLVLHLVRG